MRGLFALTKAHSFFQARRCPLNRSPFVAGGLEELTIGMAPPENPIIDSGYSRSDEEFEPELLPTDFRWDVPPARFREWTAFLEETPIDGSLTHWRSDDRISSRQFHGFVGQNILEGKLELDLISGDPQSDFPDRSWRPHPWSAIAGSARPSALLASALIHVVFFLLCAFFPAASLSGSGGYAGNVISVRVLTEEDLVPQDASPATVDSAASMPSVVGNRKKPQNQHHAKPLDHPDHIRDPGPQPAKIALTEKPNAQEPKEEKRESEKEIVKQDEKLGEGEGPQNSVASMPSIASAERRFIPAAGQDGKAFESMVLSAIREAIFFPKEAVSKGYHGEVTIVFSINKDGSVSSVRIVKASGSSILDEAALKIIENAAKKFPPLPDTMNMESIDYVVPILFKEKRG